jgi:capsular exopolysaccharide synthesis family protein
METVPDGRPAPGLREVIAAVRRRRLIILGCAVLGLVVGILVAARQPEEYRASAVLLLRPKPSETIFASQTRSDPVRDLNNEVGLANSSAVRAAVREELGPTADLSGISVRIVSESSDFIELSATGDDPEEVARTVGTYATTYIDYRRTTQIDDLLSAGSKIRARLDELQEEIATTQAPLDELDRRISSEPDAARRNELRAQREDAAADIAPKLQPLQSEAAYYTQQLDQLQLTMNLTETGGVQLVSEPSVPRSPVGPSPTRTVGLGLLLGLLAGGALMIVAEQLDDSIRTMEDLELAIGPNPIIGRIPRFSEASDALISSPATHAPVAEAFRALRTSVRFGGIDRDQRLIQVTSASPGEGKSTTVANLGVVLAQIATRVLLVDCDLRRPTLHTAFDVSNEVGLTSWLARDVILAEAIQAVPAHPNLYVLTSGPVPANPSEILANLMPRDLLRSVSAQCDVALIDTPPLLAFTDAEIVARAVDCTLLVTRERVSERASVAQALKRLDAVDAKLLGVVLNGVSDEELAGLEYVASYGRRATP